MGAMRYAAIAALSVAAGGLLSACGIENPAEPAAQPSAPASSTPSDIPTASSPTSPTSPPSPGGSPTSACPSTITTVKANLDQAQWGEGLDKARFDPVSVTICQYDAEATGDDYATVQTRRAQAASTELFGLVNSADPVAKEPKICTKELGPTYLLKFTDQDKGVLTYAVEAFGCRRLVAASFVGDGKPLGLAAPRQATPQLLKSLGMR
jgi:hypothetical protein